MENNDIPNVSQTILNHFKTFLLHLYILVTIDKIIYIITKVGIPQYDISDQVYGAVKL